MEIKLPFELYTLAYWVRPTKTGLEIIEICIDGYDIRVDPNLKLTPVIRFRSTKTGSAFRYYLNDVLIVNTRSEAEIEVKKIKSKLHRYPVMRTEYTGE